MYTRYRQRKLEIELLEDPFVHDDDGDIETPPLKYGENGSKHGP